MERGRVFRSATLLHQQKCVARFSAIAAFLVPFRRYSQILDEYCDFSSPRIFNASVNGVSLGIVHGIVGQHQRFDSKN